MTEIDVRPDQTLHDIDRPGNPSGPLLRAEGKPRQRSGAAVFGSAVVLLLVGGLVVGGWRHYQAERQLAATAEQARTFVPDVRVATVRAGDSKMDVTLPATTAAFEAANIFARTSGYVEKRYVDIGDRVKAGALLAEIVAPELDHQIAQAQATLAQTQGTLQQTQASRELAEVTNTRDSGLVKLGWLTAQQGDNDRLTLRAHSLVQAGSTFMFTLMHADVIRTQVFVPQDEAFGVQPGIDAVIRVPELPGRAFPGKVTRIATALQPGSRTLLTEIDVPNPDGALQPGIYCTVELFIPRKTPSMVIPADAVVFDENGLHVAVVDSGVVHMRKISIARDFGTQVEVHAGVKPGDQVILNPMLNLAEGSRVSVRGPQTS